MKQLPDNLLVTVNRFEYDVKLQQRRKLFHSVRVTETLTLEGRLFRLQAFIVHAGRSAEYGHYYCVAREGDQWNILNDADASVVQQPICQFVSGLGDLKSDTVYVMLFTSHENEMSQKEQKQSLPADLVKYVNDDNQRYREEVKLRQMSKEKEFKLHRELMKQMYNF